MEVARVEIEGSLTTDAMMAFKERVTIDNQEKWLKEAKTEAISMKLKTPDEIESEILTKLIICKYQAKHMNLSRIVNVR